MKQKESINKEHLEGNSGSSLDWSILEDSSEKRNLSMENDSNASSFTVHSENMRDFPEKTSAKERIATLRRMGFHRVFPQAYSYLYNARQYNNARSELSK